MSIYILRTTSGREEIVLDMLSSKIVPEKLNIKAIFHPAEIKGYLFVEGSLGSIQKALHGMMHVKGVIEQPVNMSEMRQFLEYKKERISVDIGDIVEIIGGPFKGEKGKIKRISKNKDEITVELLEASTPIPVTIATEFVKVIKHVSTPKEAEDSEKSVFDDV